MPHEDTLNLSIGDLVPRRRIAAKAHRDCINLSGKQVLIDVSAGAVRAVTESPVAIAAELELYFSCLVRKQLRFRRLPGLAPGVVDYVRVIPGLYTLFRAVTTAHCPIAAGGVDGPPVETLPMHQPERFVPDWIRIDYRTGRWVGEFGYARKGT